MACGREDRVSTHVHVRHLVVGDRASYRKRRAWAASQGPGLPTQPRSSTELRESKYSKFDPGSPSHYNVCLSKVEDRMYFI